MRLVCPYCKRNIIYYRCDSHYPVIIHFWTSLFEITDIRLEKDNYEYSINIDFSKNTMLLRKRGFTGIPREIAIIPYDKNLTPENFEQKIKTYLSFL